MAKIAFFGYGANKDYYRLKEILGKDLKEGEGATIEGFNLAVQSLKNIPEEPRNILRKVWGDSFQAYTIRKGRGIVAGKVWMLEEEDLERIKQWEFVGKDGWRELVAVNITTAGGETITAITEKSRDQYEVDRFVDGINYEFNLNKEGKRGYFSEEDEYRVAVLREELRGYYGHYANV